MWFILLPFLSDGLCCYVTCIKHVPPHRTALLQVRQAAEVHRQVRKYIRTVAKPGVMLSDMCEKLENTVGWRLEVNVVGGGRLEVGDGGRQVRQHVSLKDSAVLAPWIPWIREGDQPQCDFRFAICIHFCP